MNILVCGECGADFTEADVLTLLEDGEEIRLCPECGWTYLLLPENPARQPPRDQTIQRLFARFHNRHPEVYAHLAESARKMKSKGHAHGSIRLLYDLTRWYFVVERGEGEDLKLDDRYHSRYARLIMSREPDLLGFFELRKLRTK